MAKRKRNLERKIDKLIKEGRGQGLGQDYKPWLFIQDVPSLGRATRLKGIKTGRQHEFLSDMERDYFYVLEYSDSVDNPNIKKGTNSSKFDNGLYIGGSLSGGNKLTDMTLSSAVTRISDDGSAVTG